MKLELFQAFIPLIVPLLIAGLKALTNIIPKTWLPITAIVLGAGIDLAGHFAGLSAGNGILGGILGAAGVGLREVLDKVKSAPK